MEVVALHLLHACRCIALRNVILRSGMARVKGMVVVLAVLLFLGGIELIGKTALPIGEGEGEARADPAPEAVNSQRGAELLQAN